MSARVFLYGCYMAVDDCQGITMALWIVVFYRVFIFSFYVFVGNLLGVYI